MDLKYQSHLVITHEWLHVSYRLAAAVILGILSSLIVVFWLGYQWAFHHFSQNDGTAVNVWQEYLHTDRQQLKSIEQETRQHLEVLTEHLGRMEANLLQINSLGEQVVGLLHLDPREFNFSASHLPPPRNIEDDIILSHIKNLQAILDKRFVQLSALNQSVETHLAQQETRLSGSGKPISGGVVSSYYGHRQDPFHGRKTWHAGVDIMGKEGSEIKALASGLVSFSGQKGGYGRLVEIKHSDGLVTRYGHNKALLVQVGEWVKKGQTIALLGSSGRSTGPHVHLEVHRNGEVVDPGGYFSDLKRS